MAHTRSVNDKDELMVVAVLRFVQLRKEVQHQNILRKNTV